MPQIDESGFDLDSLSNRKDKKEKKKEKIFLSPCEVAEKVKRILISSRLKMT